ncbi:DUF1127 domain-containing protein [Terasakiella pusilla]|jgi:uncharacterized protein YjiS (DUF1127 family)|uniref:DUF1127 domain-containing protein n=1 Tax=Terasakiella pusilla TaxID=64973 RepID=UPI000A069475|nr:DUF1127 domain-containing protein [Terasakiella pusilla]
MSVGTLKNYQLNDCCVETDVKKEAKNRYLSVLNLLAKWGQRYRSRRQLAALSPHLLEDIGLSAADIHAETEKPFWVK